MMRCRGLLGHRHLSPFAIASLLLVGVVAGYGIRAAQRAPGDPAEITQLREDAGKYKILKEKLGLLAEHDIEDYLRLKGLEEKFRKADTPSPAPVSTGPLWRQVEKNLRYLKASEEDWFLKKTQIADFGGELSRSNTLQARDSRIEGCFSGAAQLVDGRVWQAKMEFAFQDGAPLTGSTSVQLSENGKIFSNSAGSGEIRDVRTFGEKSEALIVEASDNRYFQLYPMSDGSTLIGNLYVRGADPQKIEWNGTARLDRQACGNG